MPKLATLLSAIASLTWAFVPLGSPAHSLVQNGSAAILLTVPVVLSLWGLFAGEFRRFAGSGLLIFALLVSPISVWPLGLSYLPSAILLLIRKPTRLSAPAY